MAKPSPFESARAFWVKGGMPFTMATIGVSVIAFLAWWLSGINPAWNNLVFDSAIWPGRPWTLVTYALVQPSPMGLVFSGLMAFYFMGAMERAWPRARFLPACLILLVVPPLAVWLGSLAGNVHQVVFGLALPTSCWLITFAAYRPEATILLMGLVPIKAKWLGWVSAIGIVITYGYGAPLAGLVAGFAGVVAWGLAARPNFQRKPDPFADEFRRSMKTKREAEAERLKLRELLERSVRDDDE